MKRLVFVYGSLLSGLPNHRCLGNSKLIGEGSITGQIVSMPGGAYPGLIQGEGRVWGELYEVTSKQIADDLDGLEGYREDRDPKFNHYLRRPVNVVMAGPDPDTEHDVIPAEAYYYNRSIEGLTVVQSGDWRSYFNDVVQPRRRGEAA